MFQSVLQVSGEREGEGEGERTKIFLPAVSWCYLILHFIKEGAMSLLNLFVIHFPHRYSGDTDPCPCPFQRQSNEMTGVQVLVEL